MGVMLYVIAFSPDPTVSQSSSPAQPPCCPPWRSPSLLAENPVGGKSRDRISRLMMQSHLFMIFHPFYEPLERRLGTPTALAWCIACSRNRQSLIACRSRGG